MSGDTIPDAAPTDVESSTSLLDLTGGPVPSSAPTGGAAEPCDASAECGIYILIDGDYPLMIAERFCVTITELRNANGLHLEEITELNIANGLHLEEIWFTGSPISIPPTDGRTACPDPSD